MSTLFGATRFWAFVMFGLALQAKGFKAERFREAQAMRLKATSLHKAVPMHPWLPNDLPACKPGAVAKPLAACSTDGSSTRTSKPWAAHFLAFPEDTENIARLQCQLQPSFCEISAHDAVKNTAAELDEWVQQGSIKSGSEFANVTNPSSIKYVGHAWSMRQIWQAHLDHASEGDWAAIFEADAILRSDFHLQMSKIQEVVEKSDADIVYLGHCYEYCSDGAGAGPTVAELDNGLRIVQSKFPVCQHGYAVSRKGAQKLLDNSLPLWTNMDQVARGMVEDKKLISLSVCSMLVRQPWETWDHNSWDIEQQKSLVPSFVQGLLAGKPWYSLGLQRSLHMTSGAATMLAGLLVVTLVAWFATSGKR